MGEAGETYGGDVIDTLELTHGSEERGSGLGDTAGLAASALLIIKPGIAIGVSIAGLAGMTLAGRRLPGPAAGALTVLCILLAAAGSAAANVVLEAESDALMPRVAERSRALTRIGRTTATILAVGLILISLLVAFFYINAVTDALLAAAVLSYTVLYTLYWKKHSSYGTVLGGIPGALPVLIGYASIKPGIEFDGVLLFLIMLMWQQPHFLALALKYKDEYKAAGIPVLPVTHGEEYTKAFMFIHAVTLPPLSLFLSILGYCSGYFAVFAFTLGCMFNWSCHFNVVQERRYGRAFGSSIVYIMLLLIAVIVDVGMRG